MAAGFNDAAEQESEQLFVIVVSVHCYPIARGIVVAVCRRQYRKQAVI